MFRYILFAIFDWFPYIHGGTVTTCPNIIFKLHIFELGTKAYVRGSNKVWFQKEVLVQDFNCTVRILVYAEDIVSIH